MAKITQAQWKRYIQRLRQINDRAADEIRNVVTSNGGYENIDRQKLIDFAYGVSTKYGEASAALSAQMYDAIAELSAAGVPAALPAETASYQEVAKTVNGIIKKTGSEEVLAQGVGRLVKMAGTDTMLSNAYRDRPKGSGSKRKHSGAQVAWIPWGDTCPFCLTLASKGWVNQTEWAANSHSEHIHANCDCTYAVRFSKDFDVEGYDSDEYKKMYDDADGATRNEKMRAMRRNQYAENKDKINAQKRAAYAKRNRMFYTYDDPMRDVLGSAEKSHPERLKEITEELRSKNVEIARRKGAMGYQPSPVPGKPGRIVMEPDASISAWEHEFKHCKDDEELGWAGLRVFSDTEKAVKFEADAYAVEVELAKQLGYNDIAEKLQKLAEIRIRDVRNGK